MKMHVYYHNNCMDGTASASAFLNAMKKDTAETTFLPIDYSDCKQLENFQKFCNIEDNVEVVWFLDFYPGNEGVEWLHSIGKRVVVVDHHASAIEAISKLEEVNLAYIVSYDNLLSGAGLTYIIGDLIHEIPTIKTIPAKIVEWREKQILTNLDITIPNNNMHPVYDYIRRRDVWDESIPLAKEHADNLYYYLVHKGCFAFKNFADVWQSGVLENDLPEVLEQGKVIKEVQTAHALNAINLGYKSVIETKKHGKLHLLVASSPYKMDSLVGDLWNKRHPNEASIYVGLTHNRDKGVIGSGMRSNHHVACRTLAEHFGGGGHDRASGCNLTPYVVNMDDNALNALIYEKVKLLY